MPAGADGCEQGCAVGRALGRAHGRDLGAEDVGEDLAPQRARRAAARREHPGRHRHAGGDHEVEPVPESERDALDDRPGEMAPVVGEREADERAAGERVRVRAALAREVRQEQQAVAARWRARRTVATVDERVERHAGRDRVPEPAEAARGREHHRHQVPLAGDGVAERVDPALGLDDRPVRRREHDARRPERQRDPAGHDRADADRVRGLVAPPAMTGVPGRRPVAAAAQG